jgi:hypothetical protein
MYEYRVPMSRRVASYALSALFIVCLLAMFAVVALSVRDL